MRSENWTSLLEAMKATFLLSALIANVAATSLDYRGLQIHERRDEAPNGFRNDGAAPSSTVLKLRLSLAQNNIEGLQDALMVVSTPSSANYGKHLSKEEVNAYVAPKQETVEAVQAWLSDNGLNSTSLSPAGDWLGFRTTVEQANVMLNADFSNFTHLDTGESTIRTLSYSIPASLKGHLNFVHPTIAFPDPSRSGLPLIHTPLAAAQNSSLTTDAVSASCNIAITPDCVLSLYGVPSTPATLSNSSQLAVTGLIDQYANQADLTNFLHQFRPDLPDSTMFSLQSIGGGQNPQDPADAGFEANLDIQYTVGIASGVPTVFLSVGNDDRAGSGFLEIINFLLNEDSPPHVLTTSYAFNEAQISAALATQICNGYAQLGARGISVLYGSGDGGVSGAQVGSCTTFLPSFPAVCPYLTTVGATEYVNDAETSAPFSAGGFSNYFSMPSYQEAAVSAYLVTLGNTNRGLYNASGRAFPDVAALGTDVTIIVGGNTTTVNGTSCSTPIFSSIVALLNDRLVAAGRSPLGFLNPFLYSTGAAALNDITTGNNPGCGTNGFPAATGWDPVTGLGTPNFAKLLTTVGL
ncbi:family S53 protease [Amylostereum chailletii]|nr:family S53 protease [Amylostereum chailletii]